MKRATRRRNFETLSAQDGLPVAIVVARCSAAKSGCKAYCRSARTVGVTEAATRLRVKGAWLELASPRAVTVRESCNSGRQREAERDAVYTLGGSTGRCCRAWKIVMTQLLGAARPACQRRRHCASDSR